VSGIRDSVTLRDLVRPLTPEEFIVGYVIGERHFLSAPNPSLVDALLSIDAFGDLGALTRRLEGVELFGPEGFRSTVPGRVAIDFYNRGDTLYMTNVQNAVPEAAAIVRSVAVDLGVHPQHVSIEVFAGRHRAISSLHYDHDTNFQVLLRGTKRWRLQGNRHIRNPLVPNHKLKTPREESLAERLPLPTSVADLEQPVEVTATAGTCLFLPLGYWHEAEMLEECFAVNVVLKPQRWLDAIGLAARQLLAARPELRAPAFGALSEDGPLRDQARRALVLGLEAYGRALQDLVAEDVGLAVDRTAMRWGGKCEDRRLEEAAGVTALVCPGLDDAPLEIDATLVSLMRRLVAFRGSFGLQDLKVLAPTVPTGTLRQLMTEMKDMSYFELA
jgi:hypothetical protein